MASRNPQTQAKRARELAVKERRELKRAKKAAQRAAAAEGSSGDVGLPSAPNTADPPSASDPAKEEHGSR
jgi:hypothetical protein